MYYEYQKKYKHSDQLFGKLLVTVGGNEQVVFQTSTNTYEYAQHVGDYYLKNGEEIYLQDEYNNKIAFTNGFGTPTTKCAHTGCNEFIAPSGNTNCCIIHSNKCLECGNYCDEDALYCLDCIQKASSLLGK